MSRLVHHLERIPRWRLAGYMAALFALGHAAYRLAGVRFDSNSLTHFWQYLDPELLRTRPLESLYYLHIQPPLYNLFLGLVLKWFAGREQLAFQALYLLAGLISYLLLFQLMRFLGVTRTKALIFSTWFVVSPSFVLYEHWLFYTFPLAFVLTATAWFLAHWLRDARGWGVAGFFVMLFVLAGMRSLFQIVHFLLLLAALIWVDRRRWRTIVLAASLPGLLIVALYGKNLLAFDRFTTSTWLGMNFWGVVTRDLPPDDLAALVQSGELSSLSVTDRFSPVTSYPPEYQQVDGYPDVPALRQAVKSTGAVNYNHAAYIRISDGYLRDAVYIALHRPALFLIGEAKAWFSYFRSSADYMFLTENRNRFAGFNAAWEVVFYGKIPFDLSRIAGLPFHEGGAPRYPHLFLLIGLPALLVYGLAAALRTGSNQHFTRDQRYLFLFLCFNIVYVAFLGNLFEVGENNRFRFMTDPYYVTLAAAVAQHRVAPWLRARLGRGRRVS